MTYDYKALSTLEITITDCDYIIAKLTPGTQRKSFTVVANSQFFHWITWEDNSHAWLSLPQMGRSVCLWFQAFIFVEHPNQVTTKTLFLNDVTQQTRWKKTDPDGQI